MRSPLNARRPAVLLGVLALVGLWLASARTALAQTAVPTPTPPAPTQPGPGPSPTPGAPPPVVVNIQVPSSSGGNLGGGSGSTAEPILMVTGYSADLDTLKSGQAFTLTVTIKNVGAKFADEVSAAVASNSSFVGLSAPVELGKFEPGDARTFSLPVQAATLTKGAYDLQLKFTYRVGEGQEQSVTRAIGLRVGSSGEGIAGRPQVVVESVVVTPTTQSGGAFEGLVVFRNVGQRKAYDISAALKPNESLSAAQGSGSARLGDLNPGQAITHTLSLALVKAVASGRVTEVFSLDYRDSSNKPYTSDESASVDLGAAAQQSPRLIVSAHRLDPERPAPGEAFTLTLTVTNVGAGPARRVLARLGDEGGLKPFLPVDTSNVAYVPDIAAGGTATLTYHLMTDGAAAGGTYPLPVALEYENVFGDPKDDTETIGLLIISRPQVQIGLTKPLSETVRVGQTFDVAVEVVNLGRQRVDTGLVEVTSADLALAKNSLFVGPLDSSISGGLTAKATATQAGPATFKIVVHYRDELNQMQTLEREMTVNVQAAANAAPIPTTSAQTAEAGWWQALLRFFGLGS